MSNIECPVNRSVQSQYQLSDDHSTTGPSKIALEWKFDWGMECFHPELVSRHLPAVENFTAEPSLKRAPLWRIGRRKQKRRTVILIMKSPSRDNHQASQGFSWLRKQSLSWFPWHQCKSASSGWLPVVDRLELFGCVPWSERSFGLFSRQAFKQGAQCRGHYTYKGKRKTKHSQALWNQSSFNHDIELHYSNGN